MLSVLNSDGDPVLFKNIAVDCCFPAVSTPNAVIAFIDDVPDNLVLAERDLHAVGGRITEIVLIYIVVVASSFARVHGGLSGPKEESIAAVGYAVISEYVVVALFKYQDAGAVLSAVIKTVAVTPHVEIEFVVQDMVPAAAIHADADGGVEGEVVVGDRTLVTAGHHQGALAAGDGIVADNGSCTIL